MTYQGDQIGEGRTVPAVKPSWKKWSQTNSKRTKPSYKSQDCVLFPDAVPRKGKDKAGERWGNLVYIVPVCRCSHKGRSELYWLAECDCGKEKIGKYGEAGSCGCAFEKRKRSGGRPRKEIAIIFPGEPEEERWQTLKYCTRMNGPVRELCEHYSDCLGELCGIDGKQVMSEPARFTESNGACFHLASDETIKSYARVVI